MLREWFRVMISGGKIAIECPEIDETLRQYLASPEGPQRENLLRIIYGFQPIDYHYNGLNAKRLKDVMAQAGFVSIRPGVPIRRIFGPREALLRMEGQKP
jgi:hypothetical protein